MLSFQQVHHKIDWARLQGSPNYGQRANTGLRAPPIRPAPASPDKNLHYASTNFNQLSPLACSATTNEALKIHFLDFHLNFFPDNCGQGRDEHGEHFHQDIDKIKTVPGQIVKVNAG